MVTQHKSKRLTLRRGKQGLTCARAFHFSKDKSKIVLRGVCCCQRMIVGTLTTLSTRLSRAAPMKDVISTSKVDHPSSLLFTHVFQFHYLWLTLLPTFCFHKPWLTESSGAFQHSHTMEECLFAKLSCLLMNQSKTCEENY